MRNSENVASHATVIGRVLGKRGKIDEIGKMIVRMISSTEKTHRNILDLTVSMCMRIK